MGNDERNARIAETKAKIDRVMAEFEAQYLALGARIESGDAAPADLREEYAELNARSGLTALFRELAELKEPESGD